MIYSKGSMKTVVNDKILEDSSWNLHSIDNEEFNMNVQSNGKKFEIRNFHLDDLNTLLTSTHTLEDIKPENLYTPQVTKIQPYPMYSYKKSRSNRKSSKRKSSKRKKKPSSRKRICSANRCKSSSNSSTRSSRKRRLTSKAKINTDTVY